MANDLLARLANNLREAKRIREEVAKNLSLLKRFGGSVGTLESDLHNIDVKIAKQETVLKEEGITV